MLKKVVLIAVALCLIFSIGVMAEDENIAVEEAVPEIFEQMPQNAEESPQGGRDMNVPPSGDMQGRTPPNMPKGEMPPGGINKGQRPQGNFVPSRNNAVNNTEAIAPQDDANVPNAQAPNDNQQLDGQMPGGMDGFSGKIQSFNGQIQEDAPKGFLGFVKTYSTPITSVVLLGLAFIFVIFYRRKNY